MPDDKAKNHPNQRPNPDIFPCPICGNEDFNWGYTTGHSSSGFRFRSHADKKFTQGKWVRARECNLCGNIQLFTRNNDQ